MSGFAGYLLLYGKHETLSHACLTPWPGVLFFVIVESFFRT